MKRILLTILVLSVAGICYSADETEEITLTTYYPAPYGDYDELIVSGNAYLALDSGNVGIGTTSPTEKLEVRGRVKIGEYSLPDTDGNAGQTLITDGSGTISWGSVGTTGGSTTPASGTVVGGGYVEWTTFGERTSVIGCGGMWGQVEQNARKTLSVKPGVDAYLQMTGSSNFDLGVTQRRRDHYQAIQN